MQISLSPISSVIPYGRNPRNNDTAVAKVAASIKEFGWRQPIVVDEHMVVIAGHTRLLAARQLGLESVPVHVATGLNKSQVQAYRLADNRTHEDAEWDQDLLKIELGELKDADFDVALTGFDPSELDELLSENALHDLDKDRVPDMPAVPVTALDDLWILGDHKLLCGDALYVSGYRKLLGNKLADMIFTDPPYNVEYTRGARERIIANKTGHVKGKILNDDLGNSFSGFLNTTCRNLVSHCDGAIYICIASGELDKLQNSFRDAGGYWSTFIVWAKSHFSITNSDYHRQYETILYGWPKGKKRFWCGARDQADLWFINKPDSSRLHPTMKPVELVCKAIENSSKSGDIVLDVFGGSGSTLIAAEKTGRSCCMMELDPKYCDVIVQRWQEFTGKEAVLANTDKTFQFTKLARQQAN